MRFGFHLFMVDPAEFLDIARTADEWGWDSLELADAPFFPEVTAAPYPYTPDGERFWPLAMRYWVKGPLANGGSLAINLPDSYR